MFYVDMFYVDMFYVDMFYVDMFYVDMFCQFTIHNSQFTIHNSQLFFIFANRFAKLHIFIIIYETI